MDESNPLEMWKRCESSVTHHTPDSTVAARGEEPSEPIGSKRRSQSIRGSSEYGQYYQDCVMLEREICRSSTVLQRKKPS